MSPFRLGAPALLLLAGACCRAPVVDRVENPATGEKPLDLVAAEADDAGLPLAPRWQHQIEGKGHPEPMTLCMESERKMAVDRCTSQKPTLDVAASFADAICSLGTPHDVHGHVNWWPATYAGNLTWDEAAFDGDFTLALVPRGDAALVPKNGNAIHVEFDGAETVAHFDTPWWNELREAVADSNVAAKAAVNGQEAVLTGLFGLDCEHRCHVELHPVYVFALKTRDEPGDERWAFFARNAGNEGFCSRYMHVLPLDTVAFRIPWRCGAISVERADTTIVKKSPGVPADLRLTWDPGQGIAVEIDLPRADPGRRFFPRVHGELHLTWTMGGPCVASPPPPPPSPSAPAEEENSPERRLEELAAPVKTERRLMPFAVAAPERDGVVAKVELKRGTLAPKTRARASARIEEAGDKLRRDETTLRAGCEAAQRRGRAPSECAEVLRK